MLDENIIYIYGFSPLSTVAVQLKNEFKKYISKRGYKYTTDGNKATGKKIFYVYAQSGHVKHFARKYTLDGKKVSGAATLSKWGNGALYGTASTDPYNFDSGYGKLALICYK